MKQKRKSQVLEVKPMRRYRTPAYPTNSDFDPSALRACPYPFSSRFRTWVTTFGASSLLCSWVGAEEPDTAAAVENPLSVAKSGLPFRSSPYGTGQPSYMSEELARDVIEKVFRDAGFKLEKGIKYEKDDVSFVTSGYDSKARVGYVWGDWRSMDHADAIIDWSTPRLDENQIQRILQLEKDNPEECTNYLQSIGGDIRGLDEKGEYTEEIKAALELKSAREKIDALSPILKKLAGTESTTQISMREMNELEKGAEDKHDFIAVINQYDIRFATDMWSRQLIEERMAAEKIEDKEERAKALKELKEREAITGLQALEEAVSDYLTWARSQGLQN